MKLRLIDAPPFTSPDPSYKPGDCWYARQGEGGVYHWWAEGHDRKVHPADSPYADIAPEHVGKRPMMVVLPTGAVHCLHSPTFKDGERGNSGWTVVGDLPNVTVSPSIDYGAADSPFKWHGYIDAGSFR